MSELRWKSFTSYICVDRSVYTYNDRAFPSSYVCTYCKNKTWMQKFPTKRNLLSVNVYLENYEFIEWFCESIILKKGKIGHALEY